jgi:uncharacterized membrane protein YkvA (DUF1232 family)
MKNKKNSIGFFARVYIYIRALLDKRTPIIPKILGIVIIAYIILPFDLIPDTIPVLGWMDDAAIAALGIFIISKLIPKTILDEYTKKEEK